MKPVHFRKPRTAPAHSYLRLAAACLLWASFVLAQDDFFLEGLEDFDNEPAQDQGPDSGEDANADVNGAATPDAEADGNQGDADTGDGSAPQGDAVQQDDAAIPQTPEELTINEQVRRKEWELRAETYMMEAQKAWRNGDFLEAIKLFNQADDRLKAISLTQPRILAKRERIKEAVAQVNADWARALAEEAVEEADAEKFDTASSKAEAAAEKDPSLRQEMEELQRRFAELKQEAAYKLAVKPETLIPDAEEEQFEINVLLEQGKVFYRRGRYADARDKFEQVLVMDPYEVRAMRYLRMIQERLVDLSEERRQATVRERIAEVRWKWNEPVTPLVKDSDGPTDTRVAKSEEGTLMRKLDEIVIPNIDFEDATIQTVVTFLEDRSRELDPEGEGINIVLYEPPAGQRGGQGTDAEAQPDGGFDDFGDGMEGGDFGGEDFDFGAPAGQGQPQPAETQGGGDSMGKRITLKLKRMPLGEAIKYITLAANLKYRVDTNAVIIASKDMVWDEMETRFYPVEAGVLDVGGGSSGNQGGDDDGGFGDFGGDFEGGGDGEEGGGGTSREALRLFFSELGVDFPAGSRIAYNERAGKLVVTNTPKNLRALEKALQEINKTPPQVTIEAKFVEVSQNDLQELGFNWLLEEGSGFYDDGIVWGEGDDNWAAQVLKQTGSSGKTAPKLSNALRFGHNVLEGVELGSDQILSVNSILGGVSFSTIIHALDQRTNTDILSSPKVTTINGATAVLKMVETRHIATSWSEPELDSDEEGDTFSPSIPETEEQEFGVILDVTPNVAPDGYSIELNLFPRVLDFIGYDDRFNYEVVLDGESYEAKNMTPITAERSVQTKVIVWDGETVVLGGMMGERINYWDDKIPLLGDVPVVGRLFRSKGELSEKTNLLIFVTARLVNPAGMPERTSEIRGLPDFRR